MDVVCYRAGYAANKGDYLMNIEYVNNIMYSILERFNTEDYKGFLTGDKNFRFEVATIQPYKGERDHSKRPRFYQEIRDYLCSMWNGIIVEGYEADDAIGLLHDDLTVVVSVDKDFKTIPGYFYDLRTQALEYITPENACLNFWVQMLIGDDSDNIPGVKNPAKSHWKNPPNYSDKTAREALGDPMSDTHHYRKIVEFAFESQYGTEWKRAFNEIATLLFIQRKDAKVYDKCNLLYPKPVKYTKTQIWTT